MITTGPTQDWMNVLTKALSLWKGAFLLGGGEGGGASREDPYG